MISHPLAAGLNQPIKNEVVGSHRVQMCESALDVIRLPPSFAFFDVYIYPRVTFLIHVKYFLASTYHLCIAALHASMPVRRPVITRPPRLSTSLISEVM